MEFYKPNRIPMRLDMAPLIDVVFLLLVFFMLTSSMASQKAIELNLPKSATSLEKDSNYIIVSVNKLGEIFLNKQSISLSALASQVEALIRNGMTSEISLEVDSTISVQQMISVMDELKKTAAGNISLSTEEATSYGTQ